jgi:hypothetical protein
MWLTPARVLPQTMDIDKNNICINERIFLINLYRIRLATRFAVGILVNV